MAKMLPRRQLSVDVYTLACERTALILDRFDHVAVSFSGGKDSTATFQVALEVARSDPRFERHLPLRACFYDEEAIPYETEDYVRRVAQRDDVNLEWYCLPVQHRNACSRQHPFWWPWAPEDEAKWCRPLPAEAITTLKGFPVWPQEARLSIPDTNGLLTPPELGNCALLLGVRAQESMARERLLRQAVSREENWLVHYREGTAARGNVWKAYPIYDWTTEDVWTAPARLGWDWNHAYDILEMAGISHSAQRCSPAFGEEPIRALHCFATCFPDVWEKMTERVPGVGAAARYARTELYGYKSRPEKPEGTTWPDYVAWYMSRHSREGARKTADRTGMFIAQHYSKTRHPIAPKAPHPVSGMSWDFALTIAMRGDFKERRTPTHSVLSPQNAARDPDTKAKEWARWAAEIQACIDNGTFRELGHPGPPVDPWTLIPAEYQRPRTGES